MDEQTTSSKHEDFIVCYFIPNVLLLIPLHNNWTLDKAKHGSIQFLSHHEYNSNFECLLNPTWGRRWALKAPPEEKLCFWYIFVIQLIRKYLTFPKYLWQCLPYSFGVSKLPNNGFLKHFCHWWNQNSLHRQL